MKKGGKMDLYAKILLAVGIFFLFNGIIVVISSFVTAQEIRRCSAKTSGVVLSESFEKEIDSNYKRGDPRHEKEIRKVTIEYSIEGDKRQRTGESDLEVGSKLTVWYNPDDTSEVYVEGYDDSAGGLAILGIFGVAAGLVAIVFAFRRRTDPAAEGAEKQPKLYFRKMPSEQGVQALKEKMEHPQRHIRCPQCGGEILYIEKGRNKIVKCEKRGCMQGFIL